MSNAFAKSPVPALLVFALAALLHGIAQAQDHQGGLGIANRAAADDHASVLLNLYSLEHHDTVRAAVDKLAPYLRVQDVFVLVSGNHSGAPNLAVVAYWANTLRQQFPGNEIWLLTSGLTNVAMAASSRAQIPASVTTLVYDYEPGWPNEPEFNWDFSLTVSNYTVAAKLAHTGGFALAGAPTGRPVLESDLLKHHWDYGALRARSGADGMLVQTQTYGKRGTDRFKQALANLKSQQSAAGLPLDQLYPQITVDTDSVNGVPIDVAVACAREARRAGFPRISLWFAPPRADAAAAFLKARDQ